jgi:dTMP kinase
MHKTQFITFEGGEGSGKTTQSHKLVEYLKSKGKQVIWTREIGGTVVAEKIREIIVHNQMNHMTELLLIMAARTEHIQNVIRPALNEGKIVVCDRFIDSTLCYQGAYLAHELILRLHKDLFDNLMPDLTFFIDVPAEEGLRRARVRGATNKFEDHHLSEHKKIRQNFSTLAKLFPRRIVTIDGTVAVEDVSSEIINRLFVI